MTNADGGKRDENIIEIGQVLRIHIQLNMQSAISCTRLVNASNLSTPSDPPRLRLKRIARTPGSSSVRASSKIKGLSRLSPFARTTSTRLVPTNMSVCLVNVPDARDGL